MNSKCQISVLGAGSWGTALAMLLARNGHTVRLWDHNPAHVTELAERRENQRYLPGIPLPENLQMSLELKPVLQTDLLLLVIPSHAFATMLDRINPHLPSETGIAWATKGLAGEGQLLSQVARQQLGNRPLAAISGPSFASEVAKDLPTALTVAATDNHHATRWADVLHGGNFRIYTNSDIIGVQIGGAVKNVMAIAAGIADGLGFGANTRAALITRSLTEISRLGIALGAQTETFMGLAGLGDLVLTCTDNQSRNRRMGLALAQGLNMTQAREEIGQEVEGLGTAKLVHQLAQKLEVEMPITEQVYQVLYQGLPPCEAVNNLLARSLKPETR